MGSILHDFFPATERRVLRNSSPEVNARNRREINASVARHSETSPEEIDRRIRELEAEWDVERLLEANAASLSLIAVGLGITADRRWLLFPAIVSAFLLQHALQGWCPPLPIMRRLGVRTAAEINEEKTALRLLRGDFHKTKDPAEALVQVRSRSGFRQASGHQPAPL